MKLTREGFCSLMLFTLLALGCAAGPKPQPETAARLKGSAPDKIAAQRAAARGLDLEQEDQRWGIEAARERRRDQDEKKEVSSKTSDIDLNPPLDVRQVPVPPVTP